MKMVGISILTAALLLSCSSTAGEEQVVNPGDDSGLGKKPKTEVLVMSSNIRQSTTDPGVLSWAGRKDAYLAMIKDIKPGIIGLQEVGDDEKLADLATLTDYASYRIETYDGPQTEVTKKGTRIDGGVMIMWRRADFTLLGKGYFWLGEKPDEPHYASYDGIDKHVRACVWVKLRSKEGKVFYFFNTHFPHTPKVYNADGTRFYNYEQRRRCAEQAAAAIGEICPEGSTVFFTGDFNCSFEDGNGRRGWYSLAPLSAMFDNAWTDAFDTDGGVSFNGFTYDKRGRSATIDYIFFREAVAGTYRTVTSRSYGVDFVSDHYPITCTFEF